MKFLAFTILIVACTCIPARAQKKIKSVTLTDTVLYAAIDRPGDIYAVTVNAQIQRYDQDGKLAALYKAQQTPTLFDPRDGARLFAYYRHDQHYEFLNPSFETTAAYKIDDAFAIQPWLICPGAEYKLWLLDSADHSLKKINVKAGEVEVEVVVDTVLISNVTHFTTMREYQNFVFLLNPQKGIYVFNGLGRYLRLIPVPGVKAFNFLGEELYYLHDGKLHLFNLFTAETRNVPMTGPGYQFALLTEERLVLFRHRDMDIFGFRP